MEQQGFNYKSLIKILGLSGLLLGFIFIKPQNIPVDQTKSIKKDTSKADSAKLFKKNELDVKLDLDALIQKKLNTKKLYKKKSKDLSGGFDLKDYDWRKIKSLFMKSDTDDYQTRDTNLLAFPFRPKEKFEDKDPALSKKLYMGKLDSSKTGEHYNHALGGYEFYDLYGNYELSPTKYISLSEYIKSGTRYSMQKEWYERSERRRNLTYSYDYKSKLGYLSSLFFAGGLKGKNLFQINPVGNLEIQLGIKRYSTDNPQIPIDRRTQTILDFTPNYQVNLNGTLNFMGANMDIGMNLNTQTSFDFENQFNIDLKGNEDDLMQDLKIGNISFPKVGTLINAPSSLFGIRADMKFGYLYVTTVLSEQKGEMKSVTAESGATVQNIEIKAADYDVNRHFFLSKMFRDNYERSLKNLPIINSGVQIKRVEVWVTNKNSDYSSSRNIIGLVDLAENKTKNLDDNSLNTYNAQGADNTANSLYPSISMLAGIRSFSDITKTLSNQINSGKLVQGRNFEKIENSKLLNTNEYEVNTALGYISLRSNLKNDELLAVSYEYTYNGVLYKVGEFSNDGFEAPKTLIVKLIKGTNTNPELPTWDLMMKNVYSLNSSQVSSEDFNLNVLYDFASKGKLPYLDIPRIKSKQLLKIMNLDNLDAMKNQVSDGNFDFIEGITISSANGRIIFPVLEPFGDCLASAITGKSIDGSTYDDENVQKYTYKELYTKTQTLAKQLSEKNRFILKCKTKSKGNTGISLNSFNVKKGSVKITTAEGVTLTENVDYTVDYSMGSVQIINPIYASSGSSLKVSSESESSLSLQTKYFMGTRFEYRPEREKYRFGGTFMFYQEKPIAQKVNLGYEPISNMMFGLDGDYGKDIPFLTTAIDWIPMLETKEKSSFNISGEFAYLKPGIASGISGVSYIDDFEANEVTMSLKEPYSWGLSSVPKTQAEAQLSDFSLESGKNRARLSWYTIDRYFNWENSSYTPSDLTSAQQTEHYVRGVMRNELFPNEDQQYAEQTLLPTMDLSFYPQERGPYNFDTKNIDAKTGNFSNPANRWGGIMRDVSVNDFEESNIEYIEFWMMDPFLDKTSQSGNLFFNLGEISEDVLKDSRKSSEQSLPTSNNATYIDSTIWGHVSSKQEYTKSFDNDPNNRKYQDVGLDGLNDNQEKTFFQKFLDELNIAVNAGQMAKEYADPASDDYHYPLDLSGGILNRYKYYSNPEGNSDVATSSDSKAATTTPNSEDVNRDNTLNESDDYYEYKVPLNYNMKVGDNFIVDKKELNKGEFPSGHPIGTTIDHTIWYKFRIPVKSFTNKVGTINDFTSIRFIRMYLKDFSESVTLRFATLNLVKSQWRKYDYSLEAGKEGTELSNEEKKHLEISKVSIEENEKKSPVNYLLPPGIEREKNVGSSVVIMKNEQSIAIKARELADDQSRAIFKKLGKDIRRYKHLQMEVHAEAFNNSNIKDNEVSMFLRIGNDNYENYYEYQIPLKITQPGYYTDASIIWPAENRFDFDLKEFYNAKIKRDKEANNKDSAFQIDAIKENCKILVKGTPTLSNASIVMIGVHHNHDYKDRSAKSIEVWADELRLSDFDNEGGWATNGTFTTKLADIGTISVSGSMTTSGFGNIDQRSFERTQDETKSMDITASFKMDKFFPKFLKLVFPLHLNYSLKYVTPKYDPFDQDITVDDKASQLSSSAKDDYLESVDDRTYKRAYNVPQFKFNLGKPSYPWSPTNLTLYNSYSDVVHTAPSVALDRNYNTKMGFNYNWSVSPIVFEPFKKVPFLKSNYFAIIRDFHLQLTPSNIYVKHEFNRKYKEYQSLNVENKDFELPISIQKQLTWDKSWGFTYDLMRHLKFNFAATTRAVIDEDTSRVNWDSRFSKDNQLIIENFGKGGRILAYNHTVNASYTPPINKIPGLGFISSNVSYTGNYNWDAQPKLNTDTLRIGNTISNNNSITGTVTFDLQSIYRNIPLLNSISTAANKKARAKRDPKFKVTGNFNQDSVTIRLKRPFKITHKLNTKDVDVVVTDEKGQTVKGTLEVLDKNNVAFTTDKTVRNVKIKVVGKKMIEEDGEKKFDISIFEPVTDFLTMVKDVSFSYNQTNSSAVPGYTPMVSWFGLTNWDSPTIPYVLGLSDRASGKKFGENGWTIVESPDHNTPYIYNFSEKYSYKITLKPIKDLTISLKGELQKSKNYSAFISQEDLSTNILEKNVIESGDYSISSIFISTAFDEMSKDNTDSYTSKSFKNTIENTKSVSERLAIDRKSSHPDYERGSGAYPKGYNVQSQDVIIPSFISGYMGTSANNVALSPFLKFPLPNWTITYNGLGKLPLLKDYLSDLTLRHAYTCSYKTGAFSSTTDYNKKLANGTDTLAGGTIMSQYNFTRISMNEKFSPLIGVNINLKNGLKFKFDYNKERIVSLGISNYQISQTNSYEYVFGTGYVIKDLPFFLVTKDGEEKAFKNDITLSFDLSIRDNENYILRLMEQYGEILSGQNVYTIKSTADYSFSKNVNIKFYFDYVSTEPKRGSFNTSTLRTGIALRYSLN